MNRLLSIILFLAAATGLAAVDPMALEAMLGEPVILEREDGASYTGVLKKVNQEKAVLVLKDGRVVVVKVSEIAKIFVAKTASSVPLPQNNGSDAPLIADEPITASPSKSIKPSSPPPVSSTKPSTPIGEKTTVATPFPNYAPMNEGKLRTTGAIFVGLEPDTGLDYFLSVGAGGSQAMGPRLSDTLPIYPVVAVDIRYSYGYVEGENTETEVSVFGVSIGGGVGYVTPDLAVSASLLYGGSSASSTTWVWGLPNVSGGEMEYTSDSTSYGGSLGLDARFHSFYLGLDFGFEGGSTASIGFAL